MAKKNYIVWTSFSGFHNYQVEAVDESDAIELVKGLVEEQYPSMKVTDCFVEENKFKGD